MTGLLGKTSWVLSWFRNETSLLIVLHRRKPRAPGDIILTLTLLAPCWSVISWVSGIFFTGFCHTNTNSDSGQSGSPPIRRRQGVSWSRHTWTWWNTFSPKHIYQSSPQRPSNTSDLRKQRRLHTVTETTTYTTHARTHAYTHSYRHTHTHTHSHTHVYTCRS